MRAHLIPWPNEVEIGAPLAIPRRAQIVTVGAVPAALVANLAARLERALARRRDDSNSASWQVTLELAPGSGSPEAYQLDIDAVGARLRATALPGLAFATSTLLQAVAAEPLPALHIDDAPRFAWRGLLLDPARRFLPIQTLYRAVDALAALRMNVLHLHLSDDQGFRFESLAFPRLGEIGGERHYYRQDELRGFVDYAGVRGVRVVPEFDMPGHCQSWLAAYPHLAPHGQDYALRQAFGIGRASLDPTREETYEFVATLLAEVGEVFVDPYIHIGGDEVHPAAWQGVEHIDAFMAHRQLADQRALQRYFTARVCGLAAALGKRAIAWDEVLGQPGGFGPGSASALPPGLVVQAWRGMASRDRALASGHEVLLSAPYYLDLFYPAAVHYAVDPAAPRAFWELWEDTLGDRPGFAKVTPTIAAFHRWVRKENAADALPESVDTGRMVGGEGCLWGELVDADALPNRLLPRLPALAERFWTGADNCDGFDLEVRLERAVPWLFDAVYGDDGQQLADPLARIVARLPTATWLEGARGLIEQLEPVKWYARLLGDDALASRAMGEPDPPTRPYDAATPLDGLVDALPADSVPAQRAARLLRTWVIAPSAATAAPLHEALQRMEAGVRAVHAADQSAPERDVLLRLAERAALLLSVLRAGLNGESRPMLPADGECSSGGMHLPLETTVRSWLDGSLG